MMQVRMHENNPLLNMYDQTFKQFGFFDGQTRIDGSELGVR